MDAHGAKGRRAWNAHGNAPSVVNRLIGVTCQMQTDLTPLEAAEKLDKLAMSPWSIAWSQKEEGICVANLIRVSAS